MDDHARRIEQVYFDGGMMPQFLKDWFTEDNGTSYCIGRAIGAASAAVMLYKFVANTGADYIGFAAGIAAIIAAVAAKNFSERK